MKGRKVAAFSLVELVAILGLLVCLLVIGAALVFPLANGHKRPHPRLKCINNLKNVGLAFRIWATDNNDQFPGSVLLSNGVSAASIDAVRIFRMLSNELSTPKIVYCPADKQRELDESRSFSNLTSKNISYFASLTANEYQPQGLLGGDRNLQTNESIVRPGIFPLMTNLQLSWSKEIHAEEGNILMTDGSVQQTSSARLRQVVADQQIGTNLLVIP